MNAFRPFRSGARGPAGRVAPPAMPVTPATDRAAPSPRALEPLVRLTSAVLLPGELFELFSTGVAAVILPVGIPLNRLWSRLVEQKEERLPWEAPLIDIARNHHGSANLSQSLGDLAYFQPGLHGYIARKIEIAEDEAGGLQAIPDHFVQGTGRYDVPRQLVEDCRAITDMIMAALTPAGRPVPRYRTAVQRLKYQADLADMERLEAMTGNSLARWCRLGFRIDVARGKLNPKLSRKGLSDALALLTLVPALRGLVRWIDARLGDPTKAPPPTPGARLVESAHLDERYFSAVCGTRDTICTQIHCDGRWHDLPMSLDALVIFPGKHSARNFGLSPALHRVIYSGRQPAAPVDPRTGNVTLLLGGT